MADESDKIVTEAEPAAPEVLESAAEAPKALEASDTTEFAAEPVAAEVAPEQPEIESPSSEPVLAQTPAPVQTKARAPRKVRQPAPSVAAPAPVEPKKLRKAPARASKPVPVARTVAPKAAARIVATGPAPKPKKSPVTQNKNTGPGTPELSQSKEKSMVKTSTTDFTAAFQTAFADIQDKAKSAYEKGTAAFGEVNEFTKGNVEALVESGKILASGLQELGSTVVADSRSAFETITSDVKELAAVKSPTDFFQIQSTLLRRNFDTAVALGSKSTEAWLKLANEVVSPLSNRVSLAVEKVSKAA